MDTPIQFYSMPHSCWYFNTFQEKFSIKKQKNYIIWVEETTDWEVIRHTTCPCMKNAFVFSKDVVSFPVEKATKEIIRRLHEKTGFPRSITGDLRKEGDP